LYRVWGDGKQMAPGDLTDYFGLAGFTADELRAKGYNVWTPPREKGSFISEGDTPTFMNLLDNGLRAYEDGSWGGWGGRRRPDGAVGGGRGGAPITPAGPDDPGIAMGLAPAGSNENAPPPSAGTGPAPAGRGQNTATGPGGAGRGGPGGAGRGGQELSAHTTLVNARFFAAAQHDFAARLKWSVTPTLGGANHEPVVKINGPLARTVRAGQTIDLRGAVTDPDRDTVTVRWWHYQDAGTYPAEIAMPKATSLDTTFQIPTDAQPNQTIHVILEATDGGTPSLTRYQRVVLTVQPAAQ
jgi:hypothetical protein